jgi:hypothetical protein
MPGLGTAGFAGLLIAMFVAGLAGLAFSVHGALTPDPTATEVSQILGTPHWSIFHDHSGPGDVSAGCAVTTDAVVRWDGREVTGRIALRGAVGHYEANRGVTVRTAEGAELFCPFAAGEGGEDFAEWIIAEGRSIHGGAGAPRDPRLAR